MSISRLMLFGPHPRLLLLGALGILTLAVALAYSSCSPSRDTRKRGFKRKECTECHQDFLAGLADSRPHFASMDTRCEDCHDRHGLVGVLKLKEEEPALCLGCHDEMASHSRSTHGHSGLEGGSCSACHDPQKRDGRVRKLNIAFHKNCKGCHRKLAGEGGTEAPYKQCTDCHEKR